MSSERNIAGNVAVLADSGCSMRPEYSLVQELGVRIVPLDIIFQERGQDISYRDLDISTQAFYQKMRDSEVLPTTSGAVTGRIMQTYADLSQEADSIISIHITAKHSGVWSSAEAGAELAKEKANETGKDLQIEVIDSKQISLGTWFLAEQAALLSRGGARLGQIEAEVRAMIPRTQLLVVLENYDNLKKGGRANEIVQAYLGSLLHIYPILGLQDGKLVRHEWTRSAKKSRARMVEMVGASGKLARVGVVHTNAPELAEEVTNSLSHIYRGEIPNYDAGPVLAVHAGEHAVGVVFQKQA